MADPPRKTRLRELLDDPKARPRVGRAVASLLAVALVSLGAVGALVVWHLVRRGRLIRESLGPPRDVRLPDLDRAGPPDDPEEGPAP